MATHYSLLVDTNKHRVPVEVNVIVRLLFSSWSGQDDKPKKGELSLLLLLSHIFIPPPFHSILLDE